jgi:23S rRNA (cytosine1962-C5)-methyltransferase
LFPEQAANWKWIRQKISTAGRPIKVLNLFGYTGGATLAALLGGAEVTHVDGSKTAVNWAQKNMELSGLKDKPGRFLVDDARGFVQREIRRGSKYDAIIMDPPAFGRGAKDEIWKIEEDLIPLLISCQKILSDNPLFIIINGYSAGYSALAYENVLEPIVKKYGGEIEMGELTLAEKSGRLLPAGIFARWKGK